MKKIFIAFMIFFGIFAFLFADEYVTTDSGKKVLLKNDGTWEYSGEKLQNISTSEWITLKIKSWRWYNQEPNRIIIEGIVINNTDKICFGVTIIISAEDAVGNYLGNGSASLEPSMLYYDEAANFSVLIMNATCKTESLNISYQFDLVDVYEW